MSIGGYHKMLVDHPDTESDGVVRISDRHRLAVDEYLTRVGLVKSVRDLHDRRFPGTVLADARVDRAAFYGDRDVLIRHTIAKGLFDISEF